MFQTVDTPQTTDDDNNQHMQSTEQDTAPQPLLTQPTRGYV